MAGIVKLVKQLNGSGQKLVDGIGSQTHLSVCIFFVPVILRSCPLYCANDAITQAGGAGGVQAALTALAGAGVDVAITGKHHSHV